MSQVLPKTSPPGQYWVYSDGGYQDPKGAWSFVPEAVLPYGGVTPSTLKLSGSTTPELYALKRAIEYVRSCEHLARPTMVTIFSDSAEAIKFALGLHSPKGSTSDMEIAEEISLELDEIRHKYDISLKWVKAHVGIEGNERADAIATYWLNCSVSESSNTKVPQAPSEMPPQPKQPEVDSSTLIQRFHELLPGSFSLIALSNTVLSLFQQVNETSHLEPGKSMGKGLAFLQGQREGTIDENENLKHVRNLYLGSKMAVEYLKSNRSKRQSSGESLTEGIKGQEKGQATPRFGQLWQAKSLPNVVKTLNQHSFRRCHPRLSILT